MMMLMWSRKMLILRRKTDEARTQTYTLCEPAQSKCTSTCHKSRTIRKFTGNTPQTRVRSTQIRHLPLHLAKEPLSVDKLFGESKDRLQLPASVLDLSLARAHGHPGTTRSTGTRAQGHTGTTPIQGHTGTRQRTLLQLCHTLSFTHNFHTRAIFHTQLCHTNHVSLSHTMFHTHTHNFVLLLDPPPPPLSFLPSPSPLQHLVLIIFSKFGFGNSQRCSGDQWRMFCCNDPGLRFTQCHTDISREGSCRHRHHLQRPGLEVHIWSIWL